MIILPSCSKNSGSSDCYAFFAALLSGDFYILPKSVCWGNVFIIPPCCFQTILLPSSLKSSVFEYHLLRLYPQHDYHLRGPLSHSHWFLDDLHFYSLSLSDITSDFLPIDFKIHMDNSSNTSASYFLRLLSFSNVTLHPPSVITLVVIF